MSSFIFCRRAIKQRLYFQSMPSTYAVLGYSPHAVLLGRGFPPQAPAWRTALYLALYHYSFHYFFLNFSTTRGATGSRGALGCSRAHFNPRTPCGVRPALMLGMGVYFCISIHAPLAGCDFNSPHTGIGDGVISIHAPLAGCDRDTEQLLIVAVNISIHAPLAGCPFFPGGIPTHRRRRTHPVSGKKCAYPG